MTPTPDTARSLSTPGRLPTPAVVAGSEPFTADGGPHGALVLHGFTGDGTSVRPLSDALAAAGFAVEQPLLPGHGTDVADLYDARWEHWYGAAEAAYDQHRRAQADRIVVVGLSMGGALASVLAADHPEISGIAVINPAVKVNPEMRATVDELLSAGGTEIPGIGSDIAAPDVEESAYADTPLAPLLSLFDAAERFGPRIGEITCPALVLTSREDHVVPPTDSEHLVAHLGGPVEHVWLERSYHVATLDHDRDVIRDAVVDFAQKVTAGD